MNNEERLIPFLGGLVVGGAVSSNVNRPTYYQTPYYTYYPQYNYYPYQYGMNYPSTINYETNINTQYPVKMVNEYPYPIIVSSEERSVEDVSFVPIYKEN